MKKVPSYPKINAKTNITVTQTQNININSPKAFVLGKKMFRNDSKKIKDNQNNMRRNSSTHLLKDEMRKSAELKKKIEKKFSKAEEGEKDMKKSKSRQQLVLLTEKLKKLEQRIKTIKGSEKKEKSEVSVRSTSKKKLSEPKSKQIKISSAQRDVRKIQLQSFKNKTNKILKKAYSEKLAIRIPPSRKKQFHPIAPTPKNQKYAHQKKRKKSSKSQQSKEEALIHQFVTQVPNSHPDLKKSVEKSLRRNTFEYESDDDNSMEDYREMYYVEAAVKSLSKPSLFSIRQHLTQSMQTLQFLQNIRRPTSKQIDRQSISLPPSKFSETIILDLDETLIHCNEALHIPHDVSLSIRFPTGQKIDAGVNIRPFAVQFLQELAKICEIIVFTASHQCYANVVLNYLDPKKELVSYRLFRDQCWQTEEGIYIKDLRVLKNRNLERMLLVDNAAYSYFYQLQNGIPIVPYYDDKSDKELVKLLEYLKGVILAGKETKKSMKKINSEYFKLEKYAKYEEINSLAEGLYGNVLKVRK